MRWRDSELVWRKRVSFSSGGPPDLAALLARDRDQPLVETRAVELEGRRASERRGSGLGGVSQACHVVVVEPEAERLLGKLLAREVVVLLEHASEEVGGDLDR